VPHFTEDLVRRLCTEALTASSKEDIDRIMTALRTALEGHIHLAKEDLTAQAATISALESEEVA
jgi:hypothetical protein